MLKIGIGIGVPFTRPLLKVLAALLLDQGGGYLLQENGFKILL